jgi:putative ABC transport system permease protein
MQLIDGLRARLQNVFGPRAAETRMDEEIRFHVEMEAERLIREEGLPPAEARRRALVAFGGVEKTKEELREGRGTAWLSGLRLDVKLGARMLLRYPVLTGASVLTLAIAVALAASWFEFMTDLTRPRLPLPEPDRVVAVRNLDLATAESERRSVHDFERWREELRSITDLAAIAATDYSVTTLDGRVATLGGARITPSMFRVARVQPHLGRALTDADNRPGAEPVAVLGHAAWQRLFDGDRAVVGQTIRLGSEHVTVVGVMPDGFGFPLNQEIWTPLLEGAVRYDAREGPTISMAGRLAPGATLAEARAEMAAIGQRASAESPATHEHLRPEVRRYGVGGTGEEAIAVLMNIPFLLFLLVVSANVATLFFARTATRESEIALRSALGASRRRIVLQLIAEALVLTLAAAAFGLAFARWALGWGMDLFWEVQEMRPPFWWDAGISATTALYAVLLAVLGAIVIGGIPGIRATGRRLRHRLPQPGASGSGMRFGAIATGVIVVQVALCVAFLPLAIMRAGDALPERGPDGFPAESYLAGRLLVDEGVPDQDGAPLAASLYDEAYRRLAAEPGVLAVTRASRLPGFNHPLSAMEIDGDPPRTVNARNVAVDDNFFDVLGARIVQGRGFGPDDGAGGADGAGGSAVAIVDRAWAAAVFEGQSPIGRLIRYPRRPGEEGERWHEIVGVVEGMDRAVGPGTPVGVYHPLRPWDHPSLQVYIHAAGIPATLAPQVHDVVAAVDPALGIADVRPLDEVFRPVERAGAVLAATLSVVALIILLFALMGIYALMSFAVAQRAREIGIRAALGADPRRIVTAIFSRGLMQVGLGILLGAALVSLTVARSPEGLRLVAGVAVAMAAVGLIGCVVPAARALRIQPVEALRAE